MSAASAANALTRGHEPIDDRVHTILLTDADGLLVVMKPFAT